MYVRGQVRLESMLVLESLATQVAAELWLFATDPLMRVYGRLPGISSAADLAGEHGLR